MGLSVHNWGISRSYHRTVCGLKMWTSRISSGFRLTKLRPFEGFEGDGWFFCFTNIEKSKSDSKDDG